MTSIPLFVQKAYDAVISDQLEGMRRWQEMFPVSAEMRARNEEARQKEEDRKVSLMKAHQPEAGTTSICRCGHVGYSTPGYLLHLYDVIETDHEDRTGCRDDW